MRLSSCALSEMLAATALASPPLALMPFTTSSQAGSLRLDTTTLAPCAAICSQIERPMPRLPPVTTATLPVRSNIIGVSPLFDEERDRLDMLRPKELVDGFQFLQPVARVLQQPSVAREAAGIARGVDHLPDLRASDLRDLRCRSRARRIEHDGVKGVELLGQQRVAEEIAALDGEAIAPDLACGSIDGGDRRLVALEQ